jgi:hypothetical protein
MTSEYALIIERKTDNVVGVHNRKETIHDMMNMEPDLEKFLLVDIPENISSHFANARKLEDGSWKVYYDKQKFDDMTCITYRCIRERRDRLLKECDWTILPDSPLSEEKKNEFKIYRQALRDFPLICDPMMIKWPCYPVIKTSNF